MKITLFGFTESTYSRTVRMLCILKGIEYQLAPLELYSASHKALHPFLKVPVMQHGDFVLFESLAICTYLDELTVDGARLLPENPKQKAIALQWISAYIDYIAPILIHATGDVWPLEAEECLKSLDQHLVTNSFLAGPQPSLADLYLSPAIDYALGAAGFEDLLNNCPNLTSWWQKASSCSVFIQTEKA